MFIPKRRQISDVEPHVYLPGTEGETFQPGQAAQLAEGKLTKASGAVLPSHICMGPVNSRGLVPCIGLVSTTRFAAPATAAVAQSLVGSAVTLDEDGLGVTATTSGGVFVIDETDGDKQVVGHFAVGASA